MSVSDTILRSSAGRISSSLFRAGGDAHPLQVALTHRTEYHYPRPVVLAPHVIRLRPAPHCRTPVLSYSLRVTPAEHFLNWQQDPYSNYVARLVFLKPTEVFRVEVDLVAALTVINPFDFFVESYAEEFPFAYDQLVATELIPYLETRTVTGLGHRFRELLDELRMPPQRTIDYVVAVNQRVAREVRYIIRLEPGVQACEETLTKGSGSCRDSAWLLVQLLRHLGLAARFVSGYLIQLTPDVKPLDGPEGPKSDFTDLHAWAEVYLPGAGWVGLDATSGLLAGEGHLPLACVADPIQGAPITGGFEYQYPPTNGNKGKETFGFHMEVRRLHEAPRVTKPYSDAQWQTIERLGCQVDDLLTAGDVRLTMGGEPTFVSVDDREGEEWTNAALGPTKRQLAGELLLRLRDRFAPGGLLHFGQGKLYPGESLPRWALGCYWRKDGVPLWQRQDLVADEQKAYGYGPKEAEQFLRGLAEVLGVDAGLIQTGYEDVWYHLWQERNLPVNVDPLGADLDKAEERTRLARLLERGLGTVVGYVLPLEPAEDSRWRSSAWPLRREHLYLIPGDSPMGYRLPLDSLPKLPPEQRTPLTEVDPLEPRGPLPQTQGEPKIPMTNFPMTNDQKKDIIGHWSLGNWSFPDGIVRTALCVEARDGRLYVFVPPVRRVEDYLELIAAIEQTAASLNMPILLEGYPPPFDPRIQELQVTPDPGVIEVNIHPSANWSELVERTTALYEAAHASRLSTEKFQMDGRHTGTGGGNHMLIGGATPADSPVLRRPDLLRSLVAYWHNHPALSYLFSGLFVGPTSQAPRVDEARNDSLYELEIAFRQLPEQGAHLPWVVDRLFRNLLVDLSGNTHRAEFCIDKLYSPDTIAGRRGLVEMRGFEMPPHARMSLVQHLLLRALVVHFWNHPYQQRLVRWGPELHDRWMLPYFLWQDFTDVLADLRQHDINFHDDWFAPHFEFRFPVLGSITNRAIHVELRQAMEPWHVLGEQPTGGGTARYVDSSLDRVQVKVTGMTESRHVLACNGHLVPLQPTGIVGEFVAGVRYRAWQPPECLHPTIGVHTPLVFDLVDTWLGRSIGGCTYYVSHPGGRHYTTLPVNALEAEARRAARFHGMGHTPGTMNVTPVPSGPESSLTLDLRRSQ